MKLTGNGAQPTVKDVAALAGVSRATASRALSDYGAVHAETRDRVLAAAAQLGYVPNVIARSMRAGTSQTLGLIITEVGLSVFDLAVRVVIGRAHARGYQVLVANTNENLDVERGAVRTMLEKQVDGIILVPSAVDDLAFLSPSSLKGKPVVLLDRSLGSLDLTSVTADNRGGARDAVAHLIARGHRKIGLIISTSNIVGVTSDRPTGLVSTLNDRLEGFLEGMGAGGLPTRPDFIKFSGNSGDAAVTAARELLALDDRPTAIVGSNANVALAILAVAKEAGLTVGREISVIGFDDSPWAPVVTPGLTVVDLPIEAMATASVEMLIDEIAGARRPGTEMVLQMQLIRRDSVAQVPPQEGGAKS